MRTLRLAFAVGLVALLAACAEQPQRASAPASVAIAAPTAPAPEVAPLPPAPPPQDNWSRLRARFVLDDCNLEPQAETWARRFTRDPARFEAQLRNALPLLIYVQDAAEHADIPGEFALLPMVESGYDPAEPGRNGDPAGMWQIMPQTAHALGLTVHRGYDGRLDPVASTEVVMKMLTSFHDDLRDWRLVDMAFNTGEYKMIGLLDARATAPDQPLHLPVGAITRNHLAKLLAMACIVRDPARFEVELPKPDSDQRLAVAPLPQAADLASAARLAHMPLTTLRELNPGYRDTRMPADAPHHLLLPQPNADNLLAAVAADGAQTLAFNGAAHDSADSTPKPHIAHRSIAHHKVLRGESLVMIAKRYHVDARALRTWNGLASDDVHPGQTLRLNAPD